MFELPLDERLSAWSTFRKSLKVSDNPLQDVIDFWANAPFTHHNSKLDHFHVASWPTPWEIIEHNKYDDFTKAVMMGYTLLLADGYENTDIWVKIMVDPGGKKLYNILWLNDEYALNYNDSTPINISDIPTDLYLETQILLKKPN